MFVWRRDSTLSLEGFVMELSIRFDAQFMFSLLYDTLTSFPTELIHLILEYDRQSFVQQFRCLPSIVFAASGRLVQRVREALEVFDVLRTNNDGTPVHLESLPTQHSASFVRGTSSMASMPEAELVCCCHGDILSLWHLRCPHTNKSSSRLLAWNVGHLVYDIVLVPAQDLIVCWQPMRVQFWNMKTLLDRKQAGEALCPANLEECVAPTHARVEPCKTVTFSYDSVPSNSRLRETGFCLLNLGGRDVLLLPNTGGEGDMALWPYSLRAFELSSTQGGSRADPIDRGVVELGMRQLADFWQRPACVLRQMKAERDALPSERQQDKLYVTQENHLRARATVRFVFEYQCEWPFSSSSSSSSSSSFSSSASSTPIHLLVVVFEQCDVALFDVAHWPFPCVALMHLDTPLIMPDVMCVAMSPPLWVPSSGIASSSSASVSSLSSSSTCSSSVPTPISASTFSSSSSSSSSLSSFSAFPFPCMRIGLRKRVLFVAASADVWVWDMSPLIDVAFTSSSLSSSASSSTSSSSSSPQLPELRFTDPSLFPCIAHFTPSPPPHPHWWPFSDGCRDSNNWIYHISFLTAGQMLLSVNSGQCFLLSSLPARSDPRSLPLPHEVVPKDFVSEFRSEEDVSSLFEFIDGRRYNEGQLSNVRAREPLDEGGTSDEEDEAEEEKGG